MAPLEEVWALMELKRTLIKSAAWSSAGALVLRLGQLLVGVVAARILAIEDFGAFAVTLIVYTIIVNVSELGVGSALIRERGPLDEVAPTATTLSWASAAALAAVMALASGPLSAALNASDAKGAIALMAVVVLLAGPTAVPSALLTRAFRQDLRFIADLANFLVSSALLVGLGLAGWGVMALAWSRVGGQVISAIFLLWVSPTRYRAGFSPQAARRLIGFGAPLMGANLVGFTLNSVDSIVLVHVIDTQAVGLYSLANNVSGWPLAMLAPVLINVGLPLLSRVNHRADLLIEWVSVLITVLCGFFFFASCMLSALSTPLILVLYSQKWAAAAPILAFLAIYAFLRAVHTVIVDALLALNSSGKVLLINAVWIVTLTPTLVVGSRVGGPVGVAIGDVLVASIVVIPLSFRLLRASSGLSAARAWVNSWLPLAASVLAGMVAYVVSSRFETPLWGLVAGGVAAGSLYLAVTWRWIRTTGARVKLIVSHTSDHVSAGSGVATAQPEST